MKKKYVIGILILVFTSYLVSGLEGSIAPSDSAATPPGPSDHDWDGDGVVNDNDAFPRNPLEWADVDFDGFGDNWDATYFEVGRNDGPSQDGDGDGDGLTNIREFELGTDPNNAGSDPLQVVSIGDGSVITTPSPSGEYTPSPDDNSCDCPDLNNDNTVNMFDLVQAALAIGDTGISGLVCVATKFGQDINCGDYGTSGGIPQVNSPPFILGVGLRVSEDEPYLKISPGDDGGRGNLHYIYRLDDSTSWGSSRSSAIDILDIVSRNPRKYHRMDIKAVDSEDLESDTYSITFNAEEVRRFGPSIDRVWLSEGSVSATRDNRYVRIDASDDEDDHIELKYYYRFPNGENVWREKQWTPRYTFIDVTDIVREDDDRFNLIELMVEDTEGFESDVYDFEFNDIIGERALLVEPGLSVRMLNQQIAEQSTISSAFPEDPSQYSPAVSGGELTYIQPGGGTIKSQQVIGGDFVARESAVVEDPDGNIYFWQQTNHHQLDIINPGREYIPTAETSINFWPHGEIEMVRFPLDGSGRKIPSVDGTGYAMDHYGTIILSDNFNQKYSFDEGYISQVSISRSPLMGEFSLSDGTTYQNTRTHTLEVISAKRTYGSIIMAPVVNELTFPGVIEVTYSADGKLLKIMWFHEPFSSDGSPSGGLDAEETIIFESDVI